MGLAPGKTEEMRAPVLAPEDGKGETDLDPSTTRTALTKSKCSPRAGVVLLVMLLLVFSIVFIFTTPQIVKTFVSLRGNFADLSQDALLKMFVFALAPLFVVFATYKVKRYVTQKRLEQSGKDK